VLLSGGRLASSGDIESVVTSSALEKAYRVPIKVVRHPEHDLPFVLPSPPRRRAAGRGELGRVHVVGGGGMAGAVLEELVAGGFEVSAGVLNAGDADWSRARELGVEVVEAPPFSPIGDAEHEANLRAMASAARVVVAPVPFGFGNLRNLEAAVEAARRGARVLVMDEVAVSGAGGTIAKRDYCSGRASALLAELDRVGAQRISNVSGLLRALSKGG